MTPTSNQQPSRKTRHPSETVASCEGPEPKDRRRGTRSGRAEERQEAQETPGELSTQCGIQRRFGGWKRETRRQESIGSRNVDPEDLENIKEAGREAQGAQGSS